MPTGLVASSTLTASMEVMICYSSKSGRGSGGLEQDGDALPDADAHGRQSARRAPWSARRSSRAADRASRAPLMPSGWPEGDRAAVRVDVLGVVRQAQSPQHGQGLRGERLVQFEQVDVGDLEAGPASSRRVAGSGPIPMIRGGTPTSGHPGDPRQRSEIVVLHGRSRRRSATRRRRR